MSGAASAAPPERNAGMDMLRGLSIVLVVMHHIGLRIPLKKGVLAGIAPKWFLSALIYNGYEAVFIFFVLSGFLITTNSLSRWGSLETLDRRAFYLRRAARILPCLFALVAVLSVCHALRFQDYVITRENQSLGRAIVSALFFHLNWYEGATGYLPGGWDILWSLSIEEVFYLGFPLLLPLLSRARLLWPSLILFSLSLPMTRAALAGNEIQQEKAYLPGMAAITTGIAAALLAKKGVPKARFWVPLLVSLGTIGLCAVLFAGGALWPFLGNGLMLVLTFSSAALCVAFDWQARSPSPWAFQAFGFLRSFGRLSYEIYLTHMFVVFAVVRVFRARGGDLRWGILWYLPGLVLSWVLGYAVARLLSTPSERALREMFLPRRAERSP